MGALRFSMGLMERGEGSDGHVGSMQSLGPPGVTHCIPCDGGIGRRKVVERHPGGCRLPGT